MATVTTVAILLLGSLIVQQPIFPAFEEWNEGRERQAPTQALATTRLSSYTDRLASPPMYVDAWRTYGPDDLVAQEPAMPEAVGYPNDPSLPYVYQGGFGHYGGFDDPREFFMRVEAPIDINYVDGRQVISDRAIIYLDRLDSEHLEEWEWYDPITGITYYYFGSFFVPVCLQGEVTLSFKYDMRAWVWLKPYRGPYTWISVEYVIYLRVALCIIDRLDTSEPDFQWVPREYVNGLPVEGVTVKEYHQYFNQPAPVEELEELVIDIAGRTFWVRWNFTGRTWIGIRWAIGIGIRTAASSNDEENLLTRVGWAGANMTGRLWDIKLKCDWCKPAFTAEEVGYTSPDNHTATAGRGHVVRHKINYTIMYSATWDAFNFTIGPSDYARYKSPIYEVSHGPSTALSSACSR